MPEREVAVGFAIRGLAAAGPRRVVASGDHGAAVWDLGAARILQIPHAADGVDRNGDMLAILDRGEGSEGERVSILSGTDLVTFRLKGIHPRQVRFSPDGKSLLVRCEEVLLDLDPHARRPTAVVYDRRRDERLPSPEFPFQIRTGKGDPEAIFARSPSDKLVDRRTGKALATPADISPEDAEAAQGERYVLVRGVDRRARGTVIVLDGDREVFRVTADQGCFVDGLAAPALVVASAGSLRLRPLEVLPALPAPPAPRAVRVVADQRVAAPEPEKPREPKEAALVEFLVQYPGFPEADSLWGEVGRRRREDGRQDQAIDAFLKATASPKARADRDQSLDFELADIYAERGAWDKLILELDRLITRLSPTPYDGAVFEAKMRKAEALGKKLERPAEAVPIYRQLIAGYARFFPDDTSLMRRDKARLFLAECLEATGGKREALDLYERIVKESVTGTFAHYASERASRLRAEGVATDGTWEQPRMKTPISIAPR